MDKCNQIAVIVKNKLLLSLNPKYPKWRIQNKLTGLNFEMWQSIKISWFARGFHLNFETHKTPQ
jgi:hypothetical protein